jgi:hypothetical protein
VWQKCGRRHTCPYCGPRLRKRDLDHDLGKLREHLVLRKVIAASSWVSARARIKRVAGGLRIAYPQPDGTLAVYVACSPESAAALGGTIVADLDEAVTSDYDRMPEGSRVMRCRQWALAPGRAGQPSTHRSLGMSNKPPEQTPVILRARGLYRDQVPDRKLSAEVWEAHNFTVPELGTSAFQRFAHAVGLYQPEPVRKRKGRAA